MIGGIELQNGVDRMIPSIDEKILKKIPSVDEKILHLRDAIFTENGENKDVTIGISCALLDFTLNGLDIVINFTSQLSDSEEEWAAQIVESNSNELKRLSGCTRTTDKKNKLREFREEVSKFLIVREKNKNESLGRTIAFVHFRFTLQGEFADKMVGNTSLYVRDIHVIPSCRRRGVGRHLISLLELVGRREGLNMVSLPIQNVDISTKFWISSRKGYLPDSSLLGLVCFQPDVEGFDVYCKQLQPLAWKNRNILKNPPSGPLKIVRRASHPPTPPTPPPTTTTPHTTATIPPKKRDVAGRMAYTHQLLCSPILSYSDWTRTTDTPSTSANTLNTRTTDTPLPQSIPILTYLEWIRTTDALMTGANTIHTTTTPARTRNAPRTAGTRTTDTCTKDTLTAATRIGSALRAIGSLGSSKMVPITVSNSLDEEEEEEKIMYRMSPVEASFTSLGGDVSLLQSTVSTVSPLSSPLVSPLVSPFVSPLVSPISSPIMSLAVWQTLTWSPPSSPLNPSFNPFNINNTKNSNTNNNNNHNNSDNRNNNNNNRDVSHNSTNKPYNNVQNTYCNASNSIMRGPRTSYDEKENNTNKLNSLNSTTSSISTSSMSGSSGDYSFNSYSSNYSNNVIEKMEKKLREKNLKIVKSVRFCISADEKKNGKYDKNGNLEINEKEREYYFIDSLEIISKANMGSNTVGINRFLKNMIQ